MRRAYRERHRVIDVGLRAGLSQCGHRHVRSRHRTNSTSFADGRYPGSGPASVGTGRGFTWRLAASARTDSAGRIPNPGRYPGLLLVPSRVACSASTWITADAAAARWAPAGQSSRPHRQARVASRRANGPKASARRWLWCAGRVRTPWPPTRSTVDPTPRRRRHEHVPSRTPSPPPQPDRHPHTGRRPPPAGPAPRPDRPSRPTDRSDPAVSAWTASSTSRRAARSPRPTLR